MEKNQTNGETIPIISTDYEYYGPFPVIYLDKTLQLAGGLC